MDTNGWLKVLLAKMQDDLKEIKKDVKALQKSKFMFDGAKEAIRVFITVAITLVTLWMTRK